MVGFDDESTRSILMEPLSLSDLIAGGTSFEINTNFDEADTSFLDELNVGSDDENDLKNPEVMMSPWTKPFAELKIQMQEVCEFIHKRVLRSSKVGGPTVSDNARVCIRYNAYAEGDTAPYDSSFLRGSNYSFYTGRGEVLVGMEEAVRTMQVGEESQFVISYKLLFGEMGCPPRIKKQADGLFIIELISFNDVGDIDADKDIRTEDRNKYSAIIDKVRKIYVKGLDFFKQHHYRNAARAFEKAIDCLSYCHLANEQEQTDQHAFLIKLNTNLTVCCNAIDEPRKTCLVVKEIRRLTNNNPPCKALFHEGRALIKLGNFKRANQVLKQALCREPENTDIINEIKRLNDLFGKFHEDSMRIAKKALELDTPEEGVEKTVSKSMEELTSLIQTFKEKSSMKELDLPSGLTPKEKDVVEELSKRMHLKLTITHGDEVYYTLTKRNNNK